MKRGTVLMAAYVGCAVIAAAYLFARTSVAAIESSYFVTPGKLSITSNSRRPISIRVTRRISLFAVAGADGVQRYFTVMIECATASKLRVGAK